MTAQRLTQLLVLCIVLLAGIALAQYFQLQQQKVSAEDLKVQILAELRGGTDRTAPAPGEQHRNQDDIRDRGLQEPVEPEPVAQPLSQSEYWISTDYSDEKPYGFSAWLELVPDGRFILEQCFAPDYSAEVSVACLMTAVPKPPLACLSGIWTADSVFSRFHH